MQPDRTAQQTQAGLLNVSQALRFLTDIEVAKLLAVSVATIRRWRLLRLGPPYRKLGLSCVRYEYSELMEWVGQQRLGGEQAKEY